MPHIKCLLAAAVWLAVAAPAGAAEIKVLNANALTIAMRPIAAEFTKETGHAVKMNSAEFAGASTRRSRMTGLPNFRRDRPAQQPARIRKGFCRGEPIGLLRVCAGLVAPTIKV